MAGITATGIGSGIDIEGLVTQLVASEAEAPTNRLDRREARLQAELSALGSVKGALSSFQSKLGSLTNLSTYGRMSATSTNSDLFSVNAGTDAIAGSYEVEVTQMAKAHKLASDAFASSTTEVGTGTLTFQFGTYDSGGNTFTANADKASQAITIDSSNNTLEGIRDAVNAAEIGVRASIVNDGSGSRLVFVSEDTGEANSLKITASDDDGNDTDTSGLSQIAYDPTAAAGSGKNLTETGVAQDALISIDGISITSDSNTISDAVEGITLTLKSEDPGNPAYFNVSENKGAVKSAVTEFVSGFNELESILNQLTAYDAETQQAGILLGDATVRGIESSLRSIISGGVSGLSGELQSLADIGITTQSDGTLALDSSKLDDALSDYPDQVAKLFASLGTPSDSQIDYLDSTDDTAVGRYGVNITQLATQGEYTGGAIVNRVVDATNDTFELKVDGVQSGTITLSQADYTGSEDALAAEMQSKINGDSALQAAGITVSVSYDSGSDAFIITSDTYGSESTVEITTANADLGLSAAAGTDGVDVAGTIGGVTATGSGRVLTGSGDASGLEIEILGGSTGNRGNVSFSRGVAYQLDLLLDSYLESDGVFDERTDILNAGIEDVAEQRESLAERLERLEARYRAQFTAMDTLVAQLQATGDYLTNQLAALPGARSTSSS